MRSCYVFIYLGFTVKYSQNSQMKVEDYLSSIRYINKILDLPLTAQLLILYA